MSVWDPRQKVKPVACFEPAEGQSIDCWAVRFGMQMMFAKNIVHDYVTKGRQGGSGWLDRKDRNRCE